MTTLQINLEQLYLSTGYKAFEEYCTSKMKYPLEMLEGGIQGRTVIAFGIKEDGSIDSARIVRRVHRLSDSLSLAIIKKQPPNMWIPAQKDSTYIYSEVIVDFSYKLN